jgi:FkbM family methyltransferase
MTKVSRNWSSKALDAINYRRRWAELGIYYLRGSGFKLDEITICNKVIELSWPEGERDALSYEFGKIYHSDCYWLRQLDRPPITIADIGGNIGLFSITARHLFQTAKIALYEPNVNLLSHLSNNLYGLEIDVFLEAVGAENGFVEFATNAGSLHGTTKKSDNGQIKIVELSTVINRLGGFIDLLKLDAEGVEWEILENSDVLGHVREIVMEFHLWAKPRATVSDLRHLLKSRDFEILDLQCEEGKPWGLLRARNTRFLLQN